jgi:hypothetical protein
LKKRIQSWHEFEGMEIAVSNKFTWPTPVFASADTAMCGPGGPWGGQYRINGGSIFQCRYQDFTPTTDTTLEFEYTA